MNQFFEGDMVVEVDLVGFSVEFEVKVEAVVEFDTPGSFFLVHRNNTVHSN